MSIIMNKIGDQLLEFIKIDEKKMEKNKIFKPLCGSLIVVESNNKYLIGFNRWRKQWEIPGGRRDKGETLRECAIRELYEETEQNIKDVELKGLVKILKHGSKKIEYYAVYYGCIEQLEPFKGNSEMKKIILWDLKNDIGYVDEIDRMIIEYC